MRVFTWGGIGVVLIFKFDYCVVSTVMPFPGNILEKKNKGVRTYLSHIKFSTLLFQQWQRLALPIARKSGSGDP